MTQLSREIDHVIADINTTSTPLYHDLPRLHARTKYPPIGNGHSREAGIANRSRIQRVKRKINRETFIEYNRTEGLWKRGFYLEFSFCHFSSRLRFQLAKSTNSATLCSWGCTYCSLLHSFIITFVFTT